MNYLFSLKHHFVFWYLNFFFWLGSIFKVSFCYRFTPLPLEKLMEIWLNYNVPRGTSIQLKSATWQSYVIK